MGRVSVPTTVPVTVTGAPKSPSSSTWGLVPREASKDLIGAELKEDGVEDFLWAVVMLPEFQLIR